MDADARPLAVDLDGTLVRTDVLVESFLALIKQKPYTILFMPFWLLKGRAYLKHQVAKRVLIDVSLLPYHQPFLRFLRKQHASGRKLILATAADSLLARQVANHLQLFESVLASNPNQNLTGRAKLAALRGELGQQPFDYAANSIVDLPIWEAATEAIIVNARYGIELSARKRSNVSRVFRPTPQRWRTTIQALRPHQWLKNLLIFLPMLLAHEFSWSVFTATLIGFVSFSFCASSVYVINDLFDLKADRRHPRKRKRPFASGRLPISQGFVMAILLAIAGFATAMTLPDRFILMLGMYYLVTTLYSFWLKRIAMFDAIALAGLYTVRVIAGAEAGGVEVSFWLLVSSMFIFASLAMVKRTSELHDVRVRQAEQIDGRGYMESDLEVLARFGAAAGFISILVLAQYINSDEVVVLYSHPKVLWLVCPLLMYWISRLWLYTGRGKMHDDPILFTLRDRGSMVVALLICCVIYFAS